MKNKTKKQNKKQVVQNTSIRDAIADEYPDVNLLFMDPVAYDKAILGVCDGFGGKLTIAYDYEKVIKANMSMGMTYEDAVEFFEYNQIGAYVGEHTPVFIRRH